jgi:hypothetical protein
MRWACPMLMKVSKHVYNGNQYVEGYFMCMRSFQNITNDVVVGESMK